MRARSASGATRTARAGPARLDQRTAPRRTRHLASRPRLDPAAPPAVRHRRVGAQLVPPLERPPPPGSATRAACSLPVAACRSPGGWRALRPRPCRLRAFPETGRCRQRDQPFCPGGVASCRRHGEDESALAQADLLDQQLFPAVRQGDHVPWVKLTRQDLVLHGPRRYRLAEPVSPARRSTVTMTFPFLCPPSTYR